MVKSGQVEMVKGRLTCEDRIRFIYTSLPTQHRQSMSSAGYALIRL